MTDPTPDDGGDMFDRASAHLEQHPGELQDILDGSTADEADAALDVTGGDTAAVTFASALEAAASDPEFQALIAPPAQD